MIFKGGYIPFNGINSFVDAIFTDEKGQHYIQLHENNTIKDFIKVNLSNEEILKINKNISVIKGGYPVFVFVTEVGNIFVGRKNELFKDLVKLLLDREFDCFAKVLISAFYNINKKTVLFTENSNHLFKKENFNCYVDHRNYINNSLISEEKTYYYLDKIVNEIFNLLISSHTTKLNFSDFHIELNYHHLIGRYKFEKKYLTEDIYKIFIHNKYLRQNQNEYPNKLEVGGRFSIEILNEKSNQLINRLLQKSLYKRNEPKYRDRIRGGRSRRITFIDKSLKALQNYYSEESVFVVSEYPNEISTTSNERINQLAKKANPNSKF